MSENTPVEQVSVEPSVAPESAVEMGAALDVQVAEKALVPAAPEPEPEPEPERGVGQILRDAREAADLSVSDIAYRFKLGAQQVEFIEREQWDRLPGRTFIRGIVRGYARELHLDSEALLARLLVDPTTVKAESKIVPESTPVHTAESPRKSTPRDKWIVAGGVLVLLLAVLVYFVLPEDLFEEAPTEALSAPVVGAGQGMAVLQPSVVPLTDEKPNSELAVNPAKPDAVAVVTTGVLPVEPSKVSMDKALADKAQLEKEASAKLLSAGGVGLKVKFSENAWVEVRDKSGNVILSHTGTAGSEREIVGLAPLSVHVGNVAGVKLEYKGKVVDMEPHTRNNVGRLKLD